MDLLSIHILPEVKTEEKFKMEVLCFLFEFRNKNCGICDVGSSFTTFKVYRIILGYFCARSKKSEHFTTFFHSHIDSNNISRQFFYFSTTSFTHDKFYSLIFVSSTQKSLEFVSINLKMPK